jgi:hypothetical protein
LDYYDDWGFMMKDINFISEKRLTEICLEVLEKIKNAKKNKEKKIYKNVIDPFSALFEASFYDLSLSKWLEREKERQIQKTLQNAIGEFHQKILGSVKGWKDLKMGGVVDLISEKRKIIAEIKNKYNTTKGNHKIAIYDDLKVLIDNKYIDYTGYYVSIISKCIINKPFCPPDNKTKLKRPEDNRIREIDGRSFYELVTGDKLAIKKLYNILPSIISKIMNKDFSKINNDPLFHKFYEQAFIRNN